MADSSYADVFDENADKIKILAINTFIILLKTAVLNPFKLGADLREVHMILDRPCDTTICHHILVLLVSVLLVAKFFFGYVTLAANVIALFPILTDYMPKLMLPSMMAQTVDHVILSICEAVLGYFTLKYYATDKTSVLMIFLTAMTIKIATAIRILKIYSDFYEQLMDF